ncbi:DNA repair exonuclease [Choiromyces venosus 120613-1]|uniref:Double-strand break repair protein n=1 Tax=Choiromyces venosus 120613-1 TaxID=1336337 RepID=A0A3N4K9B5_9PEZI|nr:DNA repair exonuclease [Choiromyces venosus 120613-1]
MPPRSNANTLRILIATDSHVGYNERDPIRGDDSWKTFNEVMSLAKDRDVDMVLLSGDLFHDNKPSRKAMYQVMKSLRTNCYGEKPCEIEILSDTSQTFQSAGGHVNYEDPDINVAIPVFSIHGNHDDPSGEGRLCALDLLSVAGLLNYFGRTPENDNITVTPVLLQKGSTKLALYGLSNVRDERLFRTFRDGKVKFLRPDVQQKEWFNLMCVHQNHHGHTETGYLPENFLQEFLDMVIWGHEHECLIDPKLNPEMGFHVIQPGSSVATSLCEGEAVTKHAGILSITGRDFELEKIRLKTVRPFVMKEIVLAEEPQMKNVWKKNTNRTAVTSFLCSTVEDLIEEAVNEWLNAQEDPEIERKDAPLPLIRLRVEYSAPEGGRFETENPQRFSNRFVGKVANVNDVIQFYRKKSTAKRKVGSVLEDSGSHVQDSSLEEYGGSIDNVKVEKLVQEFLTNATLEILPSNGLGDAVGQFVDKDDKHAVEMFVEDSLKSYLTKLREIDDLNEETISEVVEQQKSYLEQLFAKGLVKPKRTRKKLKAKPDHWDSDLDGHWSDQPAALVRSGSDNDRDQNDDDEDDSAAPARKPAARGGRGRGRGGAAASTRGKKAAPAAKGRGRKQAAEDDDDDDVEMIDDDDEDQPSIPPPKTTINSRGRKTAAAPPARKAAAKPAPAPRRPAAATRAANPPTSQASTTRTRQTRLAFGATQNTQARDSQASNSLFHRAVHPPSDDEDIDEDEDDDFEPLPSQRTTRASRR